jgi:hypothetical protein
MKSPPTIDDLIKCAKRELALRRTVFNKRVLAGKMTPDMADHELACMAGIVKVLEGCRAPSLPLKDPYGLPPDTDVEP